MNITEKKYDISDISTIFNILNKVDKKKIAAIKKEISKKETSTQKKISVLTFNKEDVKIIFMENSLIDIEHKYTKKEIENMYISLIGSKPLSSSNKKQVIKNIELYFSSAQRAKKIHDNYKLSSY
ncbi:hypothetical protein ACYSNW_02135 [Enterococcus sp. LJL99]